MRGNARTATGAAGGRRAAAPRPVWWARVSEERPACFTPKQWATYIDGVLADSRTDSKVDKALTAGAKPAYCEDCTWRADKEREGTCHPLEGYK